MIGWNGWPRRQSQTKMRQSRGGVVQINCNGEVMLVEMLRKIISGGQTGADRAGLDFAIHAGLKHGGYVPRGRKAEDGRIDERYNLAELSTSSYPARTRKNIEESEGTVIFSLERRLSGGTKLTWETCRQAWEVGVAYL